MDRTILSIGNYVLAISDVLKFILASGIISFIYFNFVKKHLGDLIRHSSITLRQRSRIKRIFWYVFITSLFVAAVILLKIDFELPMGGTQRHLDIRSISLGLLILQLARVLDWVFSNIFIHKYFVKRDEKMSEQDMHKRDAESTAIKVAQYIVYVMALLLIIRMFNWDFNLYPEAISTEHVNLKISNIIMVILSFLIARLIIWVLTQLILYRIYKEKSVNVGGQFAINQLLKYVIYMMAFVISLQYLGINMTLILGGAAALLVGIGLGLQQTFNDFFSGLVLLFERSVAVGDILEFEGQVGKVKQIGLRSSLIETWDSTTMVVPNSTLVNQNVNNWTHFDQNVRFSLNVGVAYGTDPQKVKEILIYVANDNPYIISEPAPFVRFNDFGDSALEFTLYFFSRIYMNIGDIKSDMRYQIIEMFNQEGISIPFPHRHVIVHNEKS